VGSYFDGMLRYFEFSGRSTRMQYWMFYLVQLVLFAVAILADYSWGNLARVSNVDATSLPLTLFVAFVHIIPGITVQVRRLHDIGRSGAWYLLHFVPFGGLVLLYWACCASEVGSNYEGPEVTGYRSRPARAPKASTIPQGVRMGSGRVPTGGRPPSEGRFI
jgi:uncharacterized membrane protein YhaH (DUF805 family)